MPLSVGDYLNFFGKAQNENGYAYEFSEPIFNWPDYADFSVKYSKIPIRAAMPTVTDNSASYIITWEDETPYMQGDELVGYIISFKDNSNQ